jgi:hypothetical protein
MVQITKESKITEAERRSKGSTRVAKVTKSTTREHTTLFYSCTLTAKDKRLQKPSARSFLPSPPTACFTFHQTKHHFFN